jgi:hypothetical protein
MGMCTNMENTWKIQEHKVLYNQRNNKDETIISVIKWLFGERLMSRLIRTQNREL